ncbi:MAG: carbohydrate ABC transporter permease [Raoultibacter sp.]
MDHVFDIFILTLVTLVMLIILYPLLYIVSASFSDPQAVASGEMLLFPMGLTLEGYEKIFSNQEIWHAFGNSVLYTVVGTSLNLVMTILAAFPLSRKDLRGRKALSVLFTFTMYFSGGMIPLFLMVKTLGLYNTMWSLILPGVISVYNMIVMRSFFENSIPSDLMEASRIDGCTDFSYLLRIVLPLSTPILAVMVLFYGSAHWNQFFSAIIYLRKSEMYPLQVVLRNILLKNIIPPEMLNEVSMMGNMQAGEIIKYGLIIVSSIPMLIIYPFIQKYFVKGLMLGAVKG